MKREIIDETKNEIVDETKDSSNYSTGQKYSQPRMRFCTRCGSLLKDTASFCENCGKYRYAADNMVQPVYPGRASRKKEGRSYGVPALIMMITAYVLYLLPGVYIMPYSMRYLISIIMYFCSSVLAIVTLANSRKGKAPAVITLCLAALPIILILLGLFVTMVFFASYPDWEP